MSGPFQKRSYRRMDFSRLSDQLNLDNSCKGGSSSLPPGAGQDDPSLTRLAGLAELQQTNDDLVLPSQVVDGLLGCLGDHNKAVQRGAAQQLVRFAPQQPAIVEALCDKLTDPQPRIRWTAAYALSQIPLPDPRPLPALIENLGHQESDLRWAAATALLQLAGRHPSVLTRLLDVARSGNPVQRRMALYCLRDADQTGPAARQVYLSSLTDQQPGVRLAGLSCLGKCPPGGADVESALIRILGTDPDIGVRRASAATLGQRGAYSPAVVDALDRAAGGQDPSLARAAAAALKKLHTPHAD